MPIDCAPIDEALRRVDERLGERGVRADLFLARSESDADDIRFLASHLGLRSASAVLDVVSSCYPPERLPVRSQLLVEEMFG